MAMTQEGNRNASPLGSTTLGGIDIVALVVGALMILGPLTAAGTHASGQGWDAEQPSS